jgi:hypothetical protein
MRVRQQYQRAIGFDETLCPWLAWALLCWVCASASAGLAQPARRVAVLELESDRLADDPVARSLLRHVRQVVAERAGLELHETHASLSQLSLGIGCSGEGAACLARVCRQLGVDSVLWGRVVHERGVRTVRMERFEAGSGALSGAGAISLPERAVPDAQLQLRARELVSETLDFARSASNPLRQPASGASRPDPDPLAPRFASTGSSGVDGRLVTGYALLGGAVVSTGLSVLSWVQIERAQSNDSFAAYRRSVGQQSPSTRDVCDEARSGQSYGLDASSFGRVKSSCSAGKTFEVLQYVFLGGAVVSGGLSAFLLFGGEASERPAAGRVTLHPSVHRRGASLGARLHF